MCVESGLKYLYFLDDRNELQQDKHPHYRLLITNFQKIQSFYKKMGQILTDQVLDEVGQKFYDSVEKFNSCSYQRDRNEIVQKNKDHKKEN